MGDKGEGGVKNLKNGPLSHSLKISYIKNPLLDWPNLSEAHASVPVYKYDYHFHFLSVDISVGNFSSSKS